MGSVRSLGLFKARNYKYFEYKKVNFARFYNSMVLRLFAKSIETHLFLVRCFCFFFVSFFSKF